MGGDSAPIPGRSLTDPSPGCNAGETATFHAGRMPIQPNNPLPSRRNTQPLLDRLHRAQAGNNRISVQEELRREFSRAGWLTDPATLRSYAEKISTSRTVDFDPRRIRV